MKSWKPQGAKNWVPSFPELMLRIRYKTQTSFLIFNGICFTKARPSLERHLHTTISDSLFHSPTSFLPMLFTKGCGPSYMHVASFFKVTQPLHLSFATPPILNGEITWPMSLSSYTFTIYTYVLVCLNRE